MEESFNNQEAFVRRKHLRAIFALWEGSNYCDVFMITVMSMHSSQVHICVTENRQLVTACMFTTLSQILNTECSHYLDYGNIQYYGF